MSEVIKMKCKYCQTVNDIGNNKCSKCGNNLAIYGEPILSDDSVAGNETVQQEFKPPIEERYEQPSTETEDGHKKKDKSSKRRRQKDTEVNSTGDAPAKRSRKKPIIIGAVAAAVIALCVVVIVVVMPRLPFGKCGDDLKWRLSDGTLTISGTGYMWDWDESSDVPWRNLKGDIDNVVIESGIISIGDWAFSYFGITEITIPSGITRIGDYAFWTCGNLAKVTIPSGVTSIGDRAFSTCGLTEIIIPSGVTSIGENAFWSCSDLTTVTLPASIESVGEGAFERCGSLALVNYKGAKNDWNNIDIADGNDYLISAKKTYVS